jgi:hypothetical protein
VAPTLLSAVAIDRRTIRLTFSEAMLDSTALRTVGNYTLTPNGGSVARTLLVVTPSATDSAVVDVSVNLDLSLGVGAYTISVASVTDLAGNVIGTPHTASLDVLPAAGAIPDHCALAIGRLVSQYRGQAGMESILCVFGDRMQDVDQALANVGAYRGLDTAYGAQLDRIGEVLQLDRDGLTDAAYAIRLHGAALAKGSHGRPDELIAVLQTLTAGTGATIDHDEHFPAAVVMEAAGISNADGYANAEILRRAVPAGVRFILLHNRPSVTLFGWIDDPGRGPWAEFDNDPAAGVWMEAS